MSSKDDFKVTAVINYDESKVPQYVLPSALEKKDGSIVSTGFEWNNVQRNYVLDLFEENLYGKIPPRPDEMRFEVLKEKKDALGGIAVRKEVRIHFMMNNGKRHKMDLLLYIPKKAKGKVPAFLGLNFKGNHAASEENDVILSDCWFRDTEDGTYSGNRATEKSRSVQKHRWEFEKVISRGFASATVCYNDICPDYKVDGLEKSIFSLFMGKDEINSSARKVGAISAWAWGLSRALDYLESVPEIDTRHVFVHGHSRLGKTSLWAGANDKRFAMVISNCSGCGGSAISRRCFGETFESILNMFPHWFAIKSRDYINKENDLPLDQHMLLSLAAPRPLYIGSATEDRWADPKGEFLSAVNTASVYNLFGSEGLGTDEMPAPDVPVGKDVAYHIRTGIHDITAFEWEQWMNFAERKFNLKIK